MAAGEEGELIIDATADTTKARTHFDFNPRPFTDSFKSYAASMSH